MIMQAQRDVGILCSVGRRLLERHLVEGELFRPLAGNLLELDRVVVQIGLRQRIHVVACRHRVVDVGLEHGIEGNALHLDSMVGQHVHVVFQVLAELGLFGILENRLQRIEHLVAIKLRGSIRTSVADRDVAGFALTDSERETDNLRLHIVETRGLSVEADELCLLQFPDPGVKAFPLEDGLVIGINCRSLRSLFHCIAFTLERREQPVGLELPVPVAQHAHIGLSLQEFFRLLVQRQVGTDACQVTRHLELAVFDRLTQVFTDLALDLVGMPDEIVDVVVFGKPFGRCLWPALVDAGNIVGSVADEREVIDDLVCSHAESLHDAVTVGHGFAHGVDERDPVVDELRKILVTRRDQGFHACLLRFDGQGTDDVVSLDVRLDDEWQPHGPDDRVQRLDLGTQIIRHWRTMRLVLAVDVVPECLARRIEDHADIVRVLFGNELAQHVDDTDNSSRRLAGGIGQRWKCVKGAKKVGRAVNKDQQFLVSHCVSVSRVPRRDPL